MKTNYKKINFYDIKTGKYICSTNWYRTCKEALSAYVSKDPLNIGITALGVRASYK